MGQIITAIELKPGQRYWITCRGNTVRCTLHAVHAQGLTQLVTWRRYFFFRVTETAQEFLARLVQHEWNRPEEPTPGQELGMLPEQAAGPQALLMEMENLGLIPTRPAEAERLA